MNTRFITSKPLTLIVLFCLLFLINESCRKQNESSKLIQKDLFVRHALEDRFLQIPENSPEHIKKITEKLRSDNFNKPFIGKVIDELGLPVWDKAISGKQNGNASRNDNEIDTNTMHVIIPLVQAGSKEVNSVFACSVLGDSVTINLIREANYKNYGFSEATTLNARKVTGLMMYMQNHLFSTTSFFVRDGRIFGGINADSSKTGIVRFKKLAGGGNANRTESSYTQIEICYETCCNCGVLGNGGLTCTETCTSYTIYTSTGGGSGPGSGAGGSNDNYGTGTGGGNGNGAGGNTEIPDGSPVISVAQLVRESAGLTQSEFDFINDWNFLSEACWNYITNGDGLFNDTDKKRMVRSHIQFAMQNDAYFEFALAHYQSLFANNGSATLWFHKDYLLPAKQVLRNNIEVLKLDVVQAYYLNNNVDINGQIKQFLDESEYTEEAKTAAKVAIDVANAGILNTPTSPLHYSIAANYFPPCCPTGPILGSQYIAHISGRMAVLRAQGECNYFFTCYAMAVKEVIQTGLDVIGLIPIVGEVADVTNGVIYTISGDLTNASLSFLATIPIAGWTATGTKWAQKMIKLTPSSKGLKLNWYKVVNSTGQSFISFGKRNDNQFRRLLGLVAGDGKQAHHIIPWELQLNEVVQQAAQAKFPFHMQDILNGIGLNAAQHMGSHPVYTIRVTAALKEIKDRLGANFNPQSAYDEIVLLTNKIKAAIAANPNTPIDQLIF